MTEINEHILKLTGKVTLPKPLGLSKRYWVRVEGDVTESRDIDNQDGTFNREFKFEPQTVEVENDKGERIATKTKSKMHAQIRQAHWKWATDNMSDMEYEEFGRRLINKMEDVMEVLK